MPIKAKPLPSFEVLKEHFSYDPETGIVCRLIANKHRPNSIGPCGSPAYGGGLYVKFNGRSLKVHRIAWKLQTGEEPPVRIDHRNGNPADNRWENLRAATHQDNMANCRRPGKYLAGAQPRGKRWYAQATSRTDKQSLGSFDTEAEAHAAYVEWHLSYYGEFSVYARAKPSASASPGLRSA